MMDVEQSMQQKNDFSRRQSMENMLEVSPITKLRLQKSKQEDS